MAAQIFLASQSPRRRELLQQIGVHHEVLRVDVDETPLAGESAADYVVRLALEKASVAAQLSEYSSSRLPILAADTAVVVDDNILGKPANEKDAIAMLMQLSGRSHLVLTGIALVGTDLRSSRLSSSRVHFREISPTEAQRYWHSGEPADKAGGYGIQGLGAMFVSHLEGSYSGVMGLPLFETTALLKEAGIDPLSNQ